MAVVSCRSHDGTKQSVLNTACRAVTLATSVACFFFLNLNMMHLVTTRCIVRATSTITSRLISRKTQKDDRGSTFKPECCGFKPERWGFEITLFHTANFLLGGTAWGGVRGEKASFHPERRDKNATGIPRAGEKSESRRGRLRSMGKIWCKYQKERPMGD